MEKLQDVMREKGEHSSLSGSALIVCGRDKYYGIFSGVKYAGLIAKKRDREIARELEKILVKKQTDSYSQ